MDLPNLWLWSGLRIGPQLMDGLSAGRSPPRRKEEEEDLDIQSAGGIITVVLMQGGKVEWRQSTESSPRIITK